MYKNASGFETSFFPVLLIVTIHNQTLKGKRKMEVNKDTYRQRLQLQLPLHLGQTQFPNSVTTATCWPYLIQEKTKRKNSEIKCNRIHPEIQRWWTKWGDVTCLPGMVDNTSKCMTCCLLLRWCILRPHR